MPALLRDGTLESSEEEFYFPRNYLHLGKTGVLVPSNSNGAGRLVLCVGPAGWGRWANQSVSWFLRDSEVLRPTMADGRIFFPCLSEDSH